MCHQRVFNMFRTKRTQHRSMIAISKTEFRGLPDICMTAELGHGHSTYSALSWRFIRTF